jgi:lipopolysaccharide/colanic/teichoic acid biosynthesis glycosyltransferase
MLAIKADSRGPIFYMQPRIGHNGRKFLMYKFRTMVVDADKLPQVINVWKDEMSLVGPRVRRKGAGAEVARTLESPRPMDTSAPSSNFGWSAAPAPPL